MMKYQLGVADFEDEFLIIRNRPDQSRPDVWHRKLEMVEIGSKFFGLLTEYEYRYTKWEKEKGYDT